MQTTMSEALGRAGYKSASDRLKNLAMDIIRDGKGLMDFAPLVAEDAEMVTVLAAPYLAQIQAEMRSKGGQWSSTDGQVVTTPLAPQQKLEPRGGHSERTDGQRSATPALSSARHMPGHAKQRSPEALRATAAVVARTAFDSFTVRGMPIGELTGDQLRERAAQNLHEGYVARLLLASVPYSPAHDAMPCREWATVETLEKCIQSAAAMAEA